MKNNIHTTFDKLLTKPDKEKLLNQKGKVIWITGLSGSGKTTIASFVEKELYKKGYLTMVLDGDNIRSGINNNLSFTEDDRKENIRRIAEVAKLFLNCGVVTIACFVSPTTEIRAQAKEIIGKENFIEVYIATSFEECEKRDVKGLYKKARNGEIKNFTGLDAPYEPPINPDIKIETKNKTIEESGTELLNYIEKEITY